MLNKVAIYKIFLKMLGYNEKEIYKLTYKDITPKRWYQLENKIINEQILKRGFSDIYEKEYIRKSGEVFPVELHTSLIKDESEKPKYMWAVIRDITERKKTELELKKNEEQLSTILRDMGDGVFVLDNDRNVVIANKRLEQITKYSAKEIVGKKYDKVLSFVSEKTGKSIFKLDQVNKKDESLIFGDGLLISKDGKKVPVEGVYTSLKALPKVSLGGVGIIRDVTKEREAEKIKSEFASLAGHQLRTPLTGIKWFVELLRSNIERISKDEVVKYAEKIEESNERLISLVNDLLQSTRLDSGKVITLMTKINLRNVIEDAANDQLFLIKDKKIKIGGLDDISKEIFIEGDKTQLIQVFGNLINNAVKYSTIGSTIIIKVIKRSKSKILVAIIDKGVGIPKNQQSKIFEKFFRANNVVNSFSGSGLGLYMVKRMLENNHGRIWINSIENKGTKVFVELPLERKKNIGSITGVHS